MNAIEREMIFGMTSLLNDALEAKKDGCPFMSTEQYETRLNDLKQLEEETGFILVNSPTRKLATCKSNTKILTKLNEVKHSTPMLGLRECYTVEDIVKFANDKEVVVSPKLNGVSVLLTYENGLLVKAATKGDGHIGTDITEHIAHFSNVPYKINKEGLYIVKGEAIITDENFDELNNDGLYEDSRSLVKRLLSSLDMSLVSCNKLKFFLWNVVDGNDNNLYQNIYDAQELGFDVVPHWHTSTLNIKKLQSSVDYVFEYAKEERLPCDGVVFKYNDIEYGKSLGVTKKYSKDGIIYKVKE